MDKRTNELFHNVNGSEDEDSENEGSQWDQDSVVESIDDSASDFDEIIDQEEIDSLRQTAATETTRTDDEIIALPDLSCIVCISFFA